MFTYNIDSITFSSGEEIKIEDNSLLIIIGPNNSGKTTALLEIDKQIRPNSGVGLVVKNLSISKYDNVEVLKTWLKSNYPKIEKQGHQYYHTKGSEINVRALTESEYKRAGHTLAPFLCNMLTTKERLNIVDIKQSKNNYNDAPSEYIHVVQYEPKLLSKISTEIRISFDKDLIVNWGGGNQVWFHVGDEPPRSKANDRISPKYLMQLDNLPRLENEGDGIISFTGCILGTYCGSHKILLIDEPEAFLHPSQSRRLGAILAKSAKEMNRQVIIATHTADIIRGAINSGEKVAVCRIERTKDDLTNAYILKSEDLRNLWSKPLLQSSSALTGIFHTGVIVCESDSDCRFFESLLDRATNNNIIKTHDLYFIHGGGKGEISTLVNSYRSLNISTAAISDFDILRNESEFKKLFESFGGEWTKIDTNYNIAKSALDDLPTIKSIPKFAKEIRKIVNKINKSQHLNNSQKEEISNLLSESSKWSEAKKYGIKKLKSKQYTACKTLLTKCADLGLFINPDGELESWWREGNANKNVWIIDALEKILSDNNAFKNAEKFILKINSFLS